MQLWSAQWCDDRRGPDGIIDSFWCNYGRPSGVMIAEARWTWVQFVITCTSHLELYTAVLLCILSLCAHISNTKGVHFDRVCSLAIIKSIPRAPSEEGEEQGGQGEEEEPFFDFPTEMDVSPSEMGVSPLCTY